MNPATWPMLSMAAAQDLLTAPGAPFEMKECDIRGVPTGAWKNIPDNVAALVRESRRHGERLFSIYEEDRVSYEGNYRAVATLATWLRAAKVQPGDRVALGMRNLPEWPVVFLAATTIGAIAVPLNAWWTGEELRYVLADCGISLAFFDAERMERIAPHRKNLPALRQFVVARSPAAAAPDVLALEHILGRPSEYGRLPGPTLPELPIAADDTATIFYTSGTTGTPKGALGTHRNLLTHILSGAYGAARNQLRRGAPLLAPIPRVRLITVPLFHVTGCAASMVSGMSTGNTHVYLRRWDPLEAMRLIQRERVNIAGGVPTMVWELLDHPQRRAFDLTSLDTVSFGGSPASPELVRRIKTDLRAMPGVGWGMTETMSTVASLSAEDLLARPDSCGPPLPVAELRVRHPETQAELSPGAVGELWAKGPMVSPGYWNRPDATTAAFVDGWVRSGDLATLDAQGFCTLVGRTKDVVIRGGENIYCSEVENILNDNPNVAEAAVIGLPHRTLGEEPAAVVRCIVGSNLSELDLKAWVRGRIADSALLSASLRRKLGHTVIGREESLESVYLDNFYAAFSAAQQQDLLGNTPSGVYGDYPMYWSRRPQASSLQRMLYADQKTYLVELLMKQDQMSMASSIESRVPFLDHHFVEFSTRVPDRMKIRGNTQKYILKKAVEDLIPSEILYRKKMGFPTPLPTWFRDPKAEPLWEALRAPDGFVASYMDLASVGKLIDRHRSGFEDATDRLWRLLNLQIWGDVFITGREEHWREGFPVFEPALKA